MSFESVHFIIGETNMTHCETFEGNLASMEERNKAWFVQCRPLSPQDAVFSAHFMLIQKMQVRQVMLGSGSLHGQPKNHPASSPQKFCSAPLL